MNIYDRLCEIQVDVSDHSGVISDDGRIVAAANSLMVVKRGGEAFTYETWQKGASSSAYAFLEGRGYRNEDPDAVQIEYEGVYRSLRDQGMGPLLIPDAPLHFEKQKQRGRTNIILSSHPAPQILRELAEYGMTGLIDDVIGDVKDKGVALKRLLNYRARRTMSYKGDMTSDVKAAQNAGILSIGVATGYNSREVLKTSSPDLLVDSLTELTEHYEGVYKDAA